MIGSIMAASYMKTWWTFVAFYCVGFPFGIGITYWTPIMCGWEWFPNNKGLVSGLIIAGFGFGAFTFGFITTYIANPNNLAVDKKNQSLFPREVSDNVPRMFHDCCCIWGIFVLIGVFGVSRNPEYVRKESIRNRASKITRSSFKN